MNSVVTLITVDDLRSSGACVPVWVVDTGGSVGFKHPAKNIPKTTNAVVKRWIFFI
jgi:hypothetical protein